MKQVLKRAKLPASAISPDKKQPKLFLFQYACFPVSTMSRWMKRSLFLSLMAFTLLPTGIGRAYGQQSLFKDTAGVAVISRLGAWIPDSVQLKGSAQGMAIHRHQAFLLRDGGQCVVIDLKRKCFVRSFQLPDNTSHCNNASFGGKQEGKKRHSPLLYVSTCFGDKACLVTDVFSGNGQTSGKTDEQTSGRTSEQTNERTNEQTGGRTVQKIYYDTPFFAQDWCVDARKGALYAYTGTKGGKMYLYRFRLPAVPGRQQDKRLALNETRQAADSGRLALNETQVIHLANTDILDSIPLSCIQVAQGSKIHHGYAFLPDGDEKGAYFLHIIDLNRKQECFKLNLNHIGCEPEGLDIQRRWLYLFLHTPVPADNMLYKFRLKRSWRNQAKTAEINRN